MDFVNHGAEITPKDGHLTVREAKTKNGRRFFLEGADKPIMVGVNKNNEPYLAYVDELKKTA